MKIRVYESGAVLIKEENKTIVEPNSPFIEEVEATPENMEKYFPQE